MDKSQVQIGKIYKHYKGKLYKVHGVVRHSETLEELVLYECLYENDLGKIWVRPIDNFRETIEVAGKPCLRFSPQQESMN